MSRKRNRKRTSGSVLTAVAVSACAPIPSPELVSDDPDNVICRTDTLINSHFTIETCRTIDGLDIGRKRVSMDEMGRPTTPGTISDTLSGNDNLQSPPIPAEGSCGGNRAGD